MYCLVNHISCLLLFLSIVSLFWKTKVTYFFCLTLVFWSEMPYQKSVNSWKICFTRCNFSFWFYIFFNLTSLYPLLFFYYSNLKFLGLLSNGYPYIYFSFVTMHTMINRNSLSFKCNLFTTYVLKGWDNIILCHIFIPASMSHLFLWRLRYIVVVIKCKSNIFTTSVFTGWDGSIV